MTWKEYIPSRPSSDKACARAVRFVEGCANDAEIWDTCVRGDWLLWMLGRADVRVQELNACAKACADESGNTEAFEAFIGGRRGKLPYVADAGEPAGAEHRREVFRRCADIVRNYFPYLPEIVI